MAKAALVIIVALITLFSLLQTGFVFATTVQKFSLDDIAANIRNISPSDNGSYIGDVAVNITVHFSGYSRYKPLIPYQEINCLYRVDNGEWQNASLFSASDQKYHGSIANRVNINYVDCYYNATLQDLSNGAHLLDIDFKPDLSDHLRLSSNGTLFASDHSRPNTTLPTNSSITFYVLGNNTPNPTAPPTNNKLEPLFAAIALTIAVLLTTGLLVYYRTRKHQQ
jgi:hypothetical protein